MRSFHDICFAAIHFFDDKNKVNAHFFDDKSVRFLHLLDDKSMRFLHFFDDKGILTLCSASAFSAFFLIFCFVHAEIETRDLRGTHRR